MPTVALMIRREPYYRKAAFESGFRRLGYTIIDKVFHPKSKADTLCMWNLKAGSDEAAATLFEQRGGTVIVTENGYLQRVDKTYYALSLHGHNGSGYFPVGPEDRFSLLGIPMKDWRSDNAPGYDLVLGQRSIGSRMMASPPQWAEKRTAELRRKGFDAKMRPHPGNWAPKVPLLSDLANARAVHTWASSAAVWAIVEGIPVYHSAPHWIGAGAGSLTQHEVLNRVAWGQWHHEEIATGEPLARLLSC